MRLTWVACNASDGRVLADLPDLDVSTVAVTLGDYTSTTATLPIPTAPEGWQRATLDGGAFLVLLDDAEDGTDPVPIWGGWITRRTRSLGDTVSLDLVSIEAYLDRRFIGDRTFSQISQTEIVKALVQEFVTNFPIRVEAATSTIRRDRTYTDDSDKTVLAAITELSGVIGGPEWTIGWEHQTDPERYTPVLYAADRIGSPVADGMAPAATFESPGPVSVAQLIEDFGSGKGANDVMAVSSASEDTRPQSPRQVDSTTDRVPVEYRFTPSSSITQISTLTEHAKSALALMADGAQALTLTAVIQDAPRLGRDWWIGDDIGYALHAPAWPDGLVGVARCIGWSISLTEPATITPILATEED